MAFTEILAIIVLSYIAGIVSTIIFALNVASGKRNKKEENERYLEDDKNV